MWVCWGLASVAVDDWVSGTFVSDKRLIREKNVNSWQPSITVALFAFCCCSQKQLLTSSSLDDERSGSRWLNLRGNEIPPSIHCPLNQKSSANTSAQVTNSQSCFKREEIVQTRSRTATHPSRLFDWYVIISLCWDGFLWQPKQEINIERKSNYNEARETEKFFEQIEMSKMIYFSSRCFREFSLFSFRPHTHKISKGLIWRWNTLIYH